MEQAKLYLTCPCGQKILFVKFKEKLDYMAKETLLKDWLTTHVDCLKVPSREPSMMPPTFSLMTDEASGASVSAAITMNDAQMLLHMKEMIRRMFGSQQ